MGRTNSANAAVWYAGCFVPRQVFNTRGNTLSRSMLPAASHDSAITRIVAAVRRIVTERPDAARGRARRDVHRRAHGCVWALFKTADHIDDELVQGVFRPGRLYPAWVRFSSSSKHEQRDAVPDGRGIAIKLLAPDDALPTMAVGSRGLQDFTLLNGPAFFARNAAEMADAAELEANDRFPSLFFASGGRLRGLMALLRMARSPGDGLLQLAYFSQTPFRHGPSLNVKYRLRPRPPGPGHASPVGGICRGDNYLFEGLRHAICSPNEAEVRAARDEVNFAAPGLYPSLSSDIVFDFEIQRQGTSATRFPIDDATVVWPEDEQPFVPIAELRIPRQRFDTKKRQTFAEAMAFSPWNCLAAHEPLGSLNVARRYAYAASLDARDELNRGASGHVQPSYDVTEWHDHRATPGSEPWVLPSYSKSLLTRLMRAPAGREMGGSTWRGYLLPAALLIGFLVWGTKLDPTAFCGPLVIGPQTPSELAIPPAVLAPAFQNSCGFRSDPVWLFRYSATGSERHGGLPYWIYRVLPRMLPDYFGKRKDWSQFGLETRDDKTFYESYHELPRGLVLSNITYRIAGSEIGIPLQVVSFNCASCHRGEHLDENGHSVFIDGMPNLSIDTAGYKVASIRAIRDTRFNAASVTEEIDRLLAEEREVRPKLLNGEPAPGALTPVERVMYASLVAQAKREANAKPIDWIEERPTNGVGRLDAFGALRFEFLQVPDAPGIQTIATVDLPSIWNQSSNYRPYHHYDGNTQHTRARNFGAIVGVGGNALSIRGPDVLKVGAWIDELGSPPYPFKAPASTQVDAGERIYTSQCATCHGLYSREGSPRRLMTRGPVPARSVELTQRLAELGTTLSDCVEATQPASSCGASSVSNAVGTDPKRLEAVDAEFVSRLNSFGTSEGLWDSQSFKSTGRYIAPPLDGIWARAPYLHNGSVPTMWHLLGPESERPLIFYRGNPVYDEERMGFAWQSSMDDRSALELDTRAPGNCSGGHSNACQQLTEDRRAELIAYLKTL
jgi:hypothetical protein